MTRAILCCCFLLISTALAADDPVPVINIQKTQWKVLFQSFISEFGGQAPSSEIEKIIVSLAKSLRKLDKHILDENEKNGLREQAIQEELYKHYKEYNQLVDSRDRAVFNATLKSRSRFGQITAQSDEDRKIDKKIA